MSELFRNEVIEARRSSWLGSISLGQPLRLWVMTGFAALAAGAIGLFLVVGTYTWHSRVSGQLVPTRGLATIVAPTDGVVSELAVEEGALVVEGQRLAVVSVPRITPVGGDTALAIETQMRVRRDSLEQSRSAHSHLTVVQRQGLRMQLTTARRELAQSEQEIETQEQQVHLAQDTEAKLRTLHGRQVISEQEWREQQSALLARISSLQVLQRQAEGIRRQIAQLEQTLGEIPVQQRATEASIARDLASLEQERIVTQSKSTLAIVAPASGMIATQLVKTGQAVQTGQPMFSIIPGDGQLEADLRVPSRAIGFIELGDKVLLRYQAFPYQKFGHHAGRVARVSRSALGPAELGAQVSEPLYRVVVALDAQTVLAYGKPERLKPGMLLEADVLGDTRRLIEWVFEPLYSLKGKLAGM
ncbi:MAG: HlyD family efflux transporter periplasmic adaptor subunit [Nitrospira sp.]|nr:HlyD family efflux transporter periplasmic adaptor subunit [Nitrospira sp.]